MFFVCLWVLGNLPPLPSITPTKTYVSIRQLTMALQVLWILVFPLTKKTLLGIEVNLTLWQLPGTTTSVATSYHLLELLKSSKFVNALSHCVLQSLYNKWWPCFVFVHRRQQSFFWWRRSKPSNLLGFGHQWVLPHWLPLCTNFLHTFLCWEELFVNCFLGQNYPLLGYQSLFSNRYRLSRLRQDLQRAWAGRFCNFCNCR